MKAIETHYNGYKFRSRLEARWAVFFDHMGINYQYEPQGFEIGYKTKRYYLPDFFLTETKTWVEVKGNSESLNFDLLADAVEYGHGLPYTDDSADSNRGLIILGDVPNVNVQRWPTHPILQHHGGGKLNAVMFTDEGFHFPFRPLSFFDSLWPRHELAWIEFTFVTKEIFNGVFNCPRSIATTKSLFNTKKAYIAARSARFEHGESG